MGLHKVSSLLSVLLVTNDCKESCLISDPFLFFAAHHRTSSNCCHSTSFFSELPGEHFEISDDEDRFTEGRGDIISKKSKLLSSSVQVAQPSPQLGLGGLGTAAGAGAAGRSLYKKYLLTKHFFSRFILTLVKDSPACPFQ